jgi:hypothetical protein
LVSLRTDKIEYISLVTIVTLLTPEVNHYLNKYNLHFLRKNILLFYCFFGIFEQYFCDNCLIKVILCVCTMIFPYKRMLWLLWLRLPKWLSGVKFKTSIADWLRMACFFKNLRGYQKIIIREQSPLVLWFLTVWTGP